MIRQVERRFLAAKRILCRNMSFYDDSIDLVRSFVQKRKPFHIPRDKVLYGQYEDDYGHFHAADVDHSFSKFKYFDDGHFKGSSYCSLETVQESEGEILRIRGKLQRFSQDEDAVTSLSVSNNKAYVRPTRKCYCAVKGWLRKVRELNDHHGIAITLRTTSPMKFKININNVSYLDDELMQLPCDIDGSPDWFTYHIPFTAFNFVRKGQVFGPIRVREDMKIEGIGILFDGEAPNDKSWQSAFELDIKNITAMVQLDPENVQSNFPNLR